MNTRQPTADNPPPVIPAPRSRRGPLVWCLALALAAAGLILHLFNPADHGFFPACQFHRFTGLNCPGCGSLRALHQLTHGRVAAAFFSNALLVAALPLAGLALARGLVGKRDGRPRAAFLARPATIWLACVVVIVFGVLRNLPHPAFAWMSP